MGLLTENAILKVMQDLLAEQRRTNELLDALGRLISASTHATPNTPPS